MGCFLTVPKIEERGSFYTAEAQSTRSTVVGEDISRLYGSQLITPRGRAVLVLGLAAGPGNYVLLSPY